MHEVFHLRAGDSRAAADDSDLVRDRKLLAGTHHNDCWLWAIRWIIVAVGEQVRDSGAAHDGLVADQSARRRAGINAQVVLKDRAAVGRDRPSTWTRQRRCQVGRADVDARSERGYAVVRLADRQSVEERGIRHVSRIRRNSIAEYDSRCGNRSRILYRDRIAQHITGINDARRTLIDRKNDVLLGVEQGMIANDVACLIIGDRSARIIGSLIDDPVSNRAHEALVTYDRAIEDIRVHDRIESDCCDVGLTAGRVGWHRTRRRISGRVDQHAVHERRQSSDIHNRGAVHGRAARNVGRVGRHRVAQ